MPSVGGGAHVWGPASRSEPQFCRCEGWLHQVVVSADDGAGAGGGGKGESTGHKYSTVAQLMEGRCTGHGHRMGGPRAAKHSRIYTLECGTYRAGPRFASRLPWQRGGFTGQNGLATAIPEEGGARAGAVGAPQAARRRSVRARPAATAAAMARVSGAAMIELMCFGAEKDLRTKKD